MFKGDYEQAVVVGRRVVKANPEFVNGYKPLIAALGHLGRIDEAKPLSRKAARDRAEFHGRARSAKVYPFKNDSDREHYHGRPAPRGRTGTLTQAEIRDSGARRQYRSGTIQFSCRRRPL